MNLTHPELREGEVFISNILNRDPLEVHIHNSVFGVSRYSDIKWETKRKGIIAYTTDGEIITDAYPVFIQLKEYEYKCGKVDIK